MKKRTIFILLGVLLVSLLMVFLTFVTRRASEVLPVPTPTPPLPPELQMEKELQENYARDRARELGEKPWLLELPLKSNSYFISYDPEQNEFLATIYFTTASEISIEDQLSQAKQDALSAMRNIGIAVERETIIFFETEKNDSTPAP